MFNFLKSFLFIALVSLAFGGRANAMSTFFYPNVAVHVHTYSSSSSGYRHQYYKSFNDFVDKRAPDQEGSFPSIQVGLPIIKATALVSADNIIDRPVYIISGYDDKNTDDFYSYWSEGPYNLFSLGSQILDQGYDFIFVDIDQSDNDKSVFDYADAFQVFLQDMNAQFGINSPENAIIGYSMGGLVARIALKQLEDKKINHFTRTYISYDSPHQGFNPTAYALNIVSSIRHHLENMTGCSTVFSFFARIVDSETCDDKREELRGLYDQYLATRSQEMLITGKKSYDFYHRLNALGYPQFLRKAALSNGINGTAGHDRNYSEGELLFKVKVDYQVSDSFYPAYAYNFDSNNLSDAYTKEPISHLSFHKYPVSGHFFDNAPGSTAQVLRRVAKDVFDGSGTINNTRGYVEWGGDGWAYLYTEHDINHVHQPNWGTTAVATVSAFDANTQDLYATVANTDSPFDALYSRNGTGRHDKLNTHSQNIITELNFPHLQQHIPATVGSLNITDSNLQSCLAPYKDWFIPQLISLDCSGRNIASLSGIEQLSGLLYLNLSNNRLESISALSQLTALTQLNLASNNVADFSPLLTLPSLNTLDITNTSMYASCHMVDQLGDKIGSISSDGRCLNIAALMVAVNLVLF